MLGNTAACGGDACVALVVGTAPCPHFKRGSLLVDASFNNIDDFRNRGGENTRFSLIACFQCA
jgi:hypothetical protein